MTNTSATLLEKNVQQALEKFEALLGTEGTEALKKEWEETKKALSVNRFEEFNGLDGNHCQGSGC
ncbi:MAG: hypothetical protein QNJ70_04210 [Xenococcaceae cyanobacterium MO_207.B15]|nr:hypothetical protein [Xenococcaceae cyanobacterium MO_207.B15]